MSSSGNCSIKPPGMEHESSSPIAGSRPASAVVAAGGSTLSDRTFHCEQCGLVLDRDLNAAINLEKLAGSLPVSQNACGAESAGSSRKAGVNLSAKRGPCAQKKQEQESSYASA